MIRGSFCHHCHREFSEHVNGRCLFEATTFKEIALDKGDVIYPRTRMYFFASGVDHSVIWYPGERIVVFTREMSGTVVLGTRTNSATP